MIAHVPLDTREVRMQWIASVAAGFVSEGHTGDE